MRTSAGRQFIRFLAVGLANTVATYALFVALGLIIAPQIAYAIAFVLGLVWVTVGSSRYVFHARSSPRVLLFAAWYLC